MSKKNKVGFLFFLVCMCVYIIKKSKDSDYFGVNCYEKCTLTKTLKIITSRDSEEYITSWE